MTQLLKLLHIGAVIGFVGALAASLVIGANADESSPTAFAAVRQSIAVVAAYVAMPSLVLVGLTGVFLLIKQPALVDARWVWAKVFLGLAIGVIALIVVQPAVGRAAALARLAMEGSPVLGPLTAALRVEWIGGLINLSLSTLAAALAVWRPRLGRARDG